MTIELTPARGRHLYATTAKPSNGATIRADVSWLACSNECAPGRASLIATVAIRDVP